MNMVQNLMERLRPLVGLNGWDFCLLWKLSDDQRFLEWMDCCCGGTDHANHNAGEDLQFSAASPILPCRDGMFQHPTTKSCELLSQLPTTLSLDDSGNRIHAESLISNFPRWLNFSSTSASTLLEEMVGTRVLIPVPGGLIELFVAKQVPEDQQVVDIVKSQYSSIMMSHQEAVESANFSVSIMGNEENENQQVTEMNHFHPQASPATALETLNLSSYDFSVDRIQGLCSSPMNLLQQFSYSNEENRTKSNNNSLFFESEEQNHNHHHHHHEEVEFGESTVGKEHQGNDDKDGIKQELNGRSDSISDCSDQNADDDQQQYGNNKYRRKNGKPEAKNLQAERRRRKRLNGRLYDLRALVPIISDLKKASIIGDAIEFVKELKRQAKELEEELEANSDEEEMSRTSFYNNNNNGIPTHVLLGQNVGMNEAAAPDSVSGLAKVGNQESEINHEKSQQMEVQVEVAQIDGNGFFVKVFCEHRAGGFVRLLEALDSLGLEVTNANVTSCKSLVSNVFRVQKKDSEMVQAEYVRDSLLELTREPLPRTWTEIQVKATSENGNGMMDHNNHHPNYNHHQLLQNGHLMNPDHHYPPQLNMSFSNLI
ncbi:Transcription factor ABORTED MICROSPORES [Linum perenne]